MLINHLGQFKMFWYLIEICHYLSLKYLYPGFSFIWDRIEHFSIVRIYNQQLALCATNLTSGAGLICFSEVPTTTDTNKMAVFFLCQAERLPSVEIRFNNIIDEIRRRRLPKMTFQPESLFEWEKGFFWMYFQIVSTFLRSLQGFLWETPKLFLCGFGQKLFGFLLPNFKKVE